MSAIISNGFVAKYGDDSFPAALGPDSDQVVLFSESERDGFEQASGYWRRGVHRSELEWLVLVRTVGAFGGEPCVVLDEDESGLHIAYLGHSGMKAEALGYWMVDHGAYEVIVPAEEVFSIRVERIPVP
ncbi:hypothetical protein [Nonomuraea soli]|uniref:Uncharacterized protein n=1 Tax=Nonomuraea soli TaxID=1032476 RepID=A0A7W0CP71_9ACTN|nr:hypothetical protein [Nonomuraea soli]MBA2894659.1 hypothetical protein [Nonomuraea soli]